MNTPRDFQPHYDAVIVGVRCAGAAAAMLRARAGMNVLAIETITATVEVEHVRSDKPICKLVTTVRNTAGEDCVLGIATTYTMPLLDRQDGAAQ